MHQDLLGVKNLWAWDCSDIYGALCQVFKKNVETVAEKLSQAQDPCQCEETTPHPRMVLEGPILSFLHNSGDLDVLFYLAPLLNHAQEVSKLLLQEPLAASYLDSRLYH